jgi:hypothetical protein
MGNNGSFTPPLDIKTPWLSVVRRLQSIARTGGMALVSITVLVDQEGVPRFWLEPTCRKIEPRKSADEILTILSRDGSRSEFVKDEL